MTAATQFGALPLPVPNPTSTTTVADPGLDVLLAFAKAILNATATTAYQMVAPGVGVPVKTTRAHDPGQVVFNEKELAALFAWRLRGEVETLADDYDIETATLTLLWVFPTAQAEHQARRAPILNGLTKGLDAALKRGRHPAWVQTGDTDTQAATRGSFLWRWAGWFAFDRVTWKLQEVVVGKNGVDATYPAIQWDLVVRERVHLGMPTAPNKITATVGVPDTDAPTVFSLPIPPPDPDP